MGTCAAAAETLMRFCGKDTQQAETKIDYRFADKEEGVSLVESNTSYYQGFSQNDLDYRMQKKGLALEEFLALAKEQILDFSGDEKQNIGKSIDRIEAALDKNGYPLPEFDEIVFLKTTAAEEGGASAF